MIDRPARIDLKFYTTARPPHWWYRCYRADGAVWSSAPYHNFIDDRRIIADLQLAVVDIAYSFGVDIAANEVACYRTDDGWAATWKVANDEA